MSKQFDMLHAFMTQLACSGMSHQDIVARGYDYALMLYRSEEYLKLPQGAEISPLLQVHVMDHAADLLKFVVGKGIERQ